MKTRSLVWAALLCAFAVAAWAADVTGKWTGQVPSRGGEMRETAFTFKVDGEKLTGTMSGPQGEVQLSDGKVSGDDISFSVNMNVGGNEVKLLFKGKVAGAEIKFTRQREGSERTQEFTAKRAVT